MIALTPEKKNQQDHAQWMGVESPPGGWFSCNITRAARAENGDKLPRKKCSTHYIVRAAVFEAKCVLAVRASAG